MSRVRAPLLAALLAVACACTESPDLVAVALLESDAGSGGGAAGSGGSGGGAAGSGGQAGMRCEAQALASLRIPDEVLFASITCSVSAIALQQDQGDRLSAISSLLASTPSFDPDPSRSPIEQCVERGLWWVEGDTVRLCQALCDTLREGISAALRQACPG